MRDVAFKFVSQVYTRGNEGKRGNIFHYVVNGDGIIFCNGGGAGIGNLSRGMPMIVIDLIKRAKICCNK